jgi:hypothetical protein
MEEAPRVWGLLMAGTLLVAVRSTLLTGLGAQTAYTTADAKGHKPLLSLGYPLGAKDREKVFTARARFTHAPASLKAGRTFRNETGRFDLVITVEGVGESQATTSARAVALGTVLEEYVADNRTLGGTVTGLNWIVVEGDGQLQEMFADSGTLAELTYPLKYDARLT